MRRVPQCVWSNYMQWWSQVQNQGLPFNLFTFSLLFVGNSVIECMTPTLIFTSEQLVGFRLLFTLRSRTLYYIMHISPCHSVKALGKRKSNLKKKTEQTFNCMCFWEAVFELWVSWHVCTRPAGTSLWIQCTSGFLTSHSCICSPLT